MPAKGFAAYETIAFSLPNMDFGGHDPETARRLVREGKARWALCHGGVLALVSNEYQLKMWEHFLRETPDGFEVVAVQILSVEGTGENGYVEPYPHNDFGQPCTSPCCFPQAYGPYPWSCEGEGCFTRLKNAGLCVPCAERQGMLREPVLGKLGERFR